MSDFKTGVKSHKKIWISAALIAAGAAGLLHPAGVGVEQVEVDGVTGVVIRVRRRRDDRAGHCGAGIAEGAGLLHDRAGG